MAHGPTDKNAHSIPNPGTYAISSTTRIIFLTFAFLGLFAFVAGVSFDHRRAWASFVLNHFYFLCLALGGLFFAAIQWLTGAMWSAPVRRLSEAFTAYLPFVLIGSIVIYF